MTEYDLFIQHIPMIAEIIIKCRKMNKKQYKEYKAEVLEECHDTAKKFIKKVFIVIDSKVLEN